MAKKALPARSREKAESNPYTASQVVDIGVWEAALRNGTAWRRAFFAMVALVFCTLVLAIFLASKDHTESVVYKEDASGDIALIGLSSHNRIPTDLAVKAQLTAWIAAVRDIPGHDDDLIDQNAQLAIYTIARSSPAYNDYVQFVHDDNPKTLAKKGYFRTVPVGGVEVDKLSDLTYRIAWKERLGFTGSGGKLSAYNGTVTLAQEPNVPNDPLIGQYNPAGVYIQSYDMSWSVLR